MDENRTRFEANIWISTCKDFLNRGDINNAESALEKALKIMPDHEEKVAMLELINDAKTKREAKIRQTTKERELLAREHQARSKDRLAKQPLRSPTKIVTSQGRTAKETHRKQSIAVPSGDSRPKRALPKIDKKKLDEDIRRHRLSREALLKPPPELECEDGLRHLLIDGIKKVTNRDLAKAKTTFSKITKEYPDSYLGWLYLGDVSVFLGDLKDGQKSHAKAVKIEPSCDYPKLEVMANNGVGAFEIEMAYGHRVKDVWSDPIGIMTENGPRTFGSQNWSFKLPPKAKLSAGRTQSLWILSQELHPDVGAFMAIDQAVLMSEFKAIVKLGLKSDNRDAHLNYAIALEYSDQLDDALNAFKELLLSNPLDELAKRGLYRTMTRSYFGPPKLASYHHHPLYKSAVPEFQSMRELFSIPLLQMARKSFADKVTELEILQLELRCFDLSI